jgi:uncharacterized protein (TIGR02996 family)
MTDSDSDALYRAIVRFPEDDTPRLVYADWLQENDRMEEGEFLRTQCQLAVSQPLFDEYPALLDRDEELRMWLKTHVTGPRPTFPGGLYVDGRDMWWWQSYRGYPRFLEFDGNEHSGTKAMRTLANSIARAFDTLPTRWLVVRDITLSQLTTLLKQPVLAGLSQLTLVLLVSGDEANQAARLVANCRHLRNLRGLALAFTFGDAGCESLARAQFQNLEWFSPECVEWSATGVNALAEAGWFQELRELTLDDQLSTEALVALSNLKPLSRLYSLNLANNLTVEDEGWRVFGESRTFPALTRLQLAGADLRADRLSHVARIKSPIHDFTAAGTYLQLADIDDFLAAPWIRTLRMLDLSFNGLQPAQTRLVASCKKFTQLRHLSLGFNALGATSLNALTANAALRDLRSLRLLGNDTHNGGLTPGHFEKFLTKLNMPDLRHLDLSGRPVGATAARKLTDKRFASLTRLCLSNARITDSAVSAILASPNLQNLIQLELDGNNLKAGPKLLGDPAVLPALALCSLRDNPIRVTLARKLRARAGIVGLPKPAKRRYV